MKQSLADADADADTASAHADADVIYGISFRGCIIVMAGGWPGPSFDRHVVGNEAVDTGAADEATDEEYEQIYDQNKD